MNLATFKILTVYFEIKDFAYHYKLFNVISN